MTARGGLSPLEARIVDHVAEWIERVNPAENFTAATSPWR